jgi:hypothetical protein
MAPQDYITDQDVQNYGPELINLTQRSALHAVAPHLQNLEQQNAEMQRRLAVEARRNLDAAVERAIPNYRELDQDPEWHRWLLGIDSLSGRQRQQLLNEATASGDAQRVLSFFRSFFRGAGQGADTGQTAQPRSQRVPTWGPDRPTYTRAQIAKLYEQHLRGAYKDREAEWQRLEADIIRASGEGRIQGGLAIGVK